VLCWTFFGGACCIVCTPARQPSMTYFDTHPVNLILFDRIVVVLLVVLVVSSCPFCDQTTALFRAWEAETRPSVPGSGHQRQVVIGISANGETLLNCTIEVAIGIYCPRQITPVKLTLSTAHLVIVAYARWLKH